MKRILIVVTIICIFSVTFFGGTVKAQDNDTHIFEEKRVLFISSYSSSFPTYFEQINGLKDVFDQYPIILDVESMDSKRFFDGQNLNLFYDVIEYKMSKVDYDLLITSDDNAINFAMTNKDTLFKDLPIVFFGVNNVDNAELYSSEPDVTGVVEDISLEETIDLALELNDKATIVTGLFDNTTSGQSDLIRFMELDESYPNHTFNTVDLSNLTMDEFLTEINGLTNDHVVLLFSALRDKDGASYEFNESLELILEGTNQPIYHMFQHGINEGLIGGKVVSHYEQGKTAAEIAIASFKGKSFDTIDLVIESPNVYMINYDVSKQFDYNVNHLPENTIFLHRDYTLYQQYPMYFISGVLFLIIQTTIIGVLIVTVRHRNKARIEIQNNKDKLETAYFELEQANDKLHYRSIHDELTGLYNRNYFEEQFPRLVDLEDDVSTSIILVDVNGLKLINDAFGHASGDIALKETSNLLLKLFIDCDIFRVGGDEFAIITYDKSETVILELIREFNDEISKKMISGIRLSVSSGFAIYDEKKSLRELFTEAEDWMYREKLSQVPSNRSSIIEAIITTINQKDLYSEQHSKRVSEISVEIARLMNLGENMISEIRTAGLLHDIGKIIVPSHILNKKGKLTKEEYEDIKKHSETGYRILNSVSSMREIAQYVLCHHERPDGLGYPRGLKTNDIPLQSRIIALADAIDAMLTDRMYRPRLTKEQCYEELDRNKGSQFCLTITKIVLENFDHLFECVDKIYKGSS